MAIDAIVTRGTARRPAAGEVTVPMWTLRVLQGMVTLVYLWGAVAKANADWLAGEPMRTWLRDYALLAGVSVTDERVVMAMSYGGLIVDGLVSLLVFVPVLRPVCMLVLAVFHVLNAAMFDIGVFPACMLASLLLYTGTERVDAYDGSDVLAALAARENGKDGGADNDEEEDDDEGGKAGRHLRKGTPSTPNTFTTVLLGLFFAVQLLLPARAFFYGDGNVSWTREGELFSWRMMLNEQATFFSAIQKRRVAGADDGMLILQPVEPDLGPDQIRRLMYEPDMMEQYARRKARLMRHELGITRPQVFIDLWRSLNGSPYQRFVDVGVDLAHVGQTRFLHSRSWILPQLLEFRTPEWRVKIESELQRWAARGYTVFAFAGRPGESRVQHFFENVAIYVLEGELDVLHGPTLEDLRRVHVEPGHQAVTMQTVRRHQFVEVPADNPFQFYLPTDDDSDAVVDFKDDADDYEEDKEPYGPACWLMMIHGDDRQSNFAEQWSTSPHLIAAIRQQKQHAAEKLEAEQQGEAAAAAEPVAADVGMAANKPIGFNFKTDM